MKKLSDDYFWSLRIQENNPYNNYSCLGSIDNNENSLFGDCEYNTENKIWIDYNVDNTAPVTKTKIPYLAHQIKVYLEADDELSGVDSTYYCVNTNPDETCDSFKKLEKKYITLWSLPVFL